MRAQIRRLHAPDAPSGLADYRPDDDTDFELLVQIIAGPLGGEGEESFDLEVVTPTRIAKRLQGKGPISGRHLLIVERFDLGAITRWIERAVTSCAGETWRDVAEQLARIGRWEFEDDSG